VKINGTITGKPAADAEFARLRAALAEAQAVTPTAEASDRAHEPLARAEALTRLLNEPEASAEAQSVLHGSFRPESAEGSPGETQR
jgi:hypothetical protein